LYYHSQAASAVLEIAVKKYVLAMTAFLVLATVAATPAQSRAGQVSTKPSQLAAIRDKALLQSVIQQDCCGLPFCPPLCP